MTNLPKWPAEKPMDALLEDGLWDLRQLCRFLRCSTSWAYKASVRGDLPTLHLGGLLRFSPPDVRTWLATKRTGAATAAPRQGGA